MRERGAQSFAQRLRKVQRGANLRDADLARWFGRRQTTVKGWLEGREPAGTPADIRDLFALVVKLETAVGSNKLPVPWMPTAKRIAYLTRLRRQKQPRGELSA